MNTPELMMFGVPNSGKTHYAGQLYGRLQRCPGSLKLNPKAGAPNDLSPLEDVLRSLENGQAAAHTSTDTWAEVSLPIVDQAGKEITINWPDYGGEQLNQVLSSRSVNNTWQVRLREATGWLLLLRLSSEVTFTSSLMNLPQGKGLLVGDNRQTVVWDTNARWVEKLQILQHVAGHSCTNPLSSPKLAVLLSCYDELEDQAEKHKTPLELLTLKLPLLSSFIQNNWHASAFSVWGLSALGQQLEGNSSVDSFIEKGPESQGWVVLPDSTINKSSDITLPIQWLLEDTQC